MFTNKIKYTIIILAASIVAIIIAQVYWILVSYSIKEELFERSVNEAMVNAVKKIQSYRVISLIDEVQVPDSMSSCVVIKKDKSFKTNYNGLWVTSNDSLKLTLTSDEDGINDNLKKKVFKTIIYSGCNNKSDSSSSVFVKHVVKQVISEFDNDRNPLVSVNSEKINAVLKKELIDKNINTPYEYSVIDKNDSIKSSLKTPGFTNKMLKDAFRVRLFPENLIAPSDYLAVTFPDKTRYLLGSLIGSMLLTAILSALIIVTFILTIRNFIRNNRIVQIRNDFINNMTHELKTPISTINLAADSLFNEKVLSDKDQVKFFANAIRQENSRMNKHVEQVLQLSLIENNGFALEPVKTDMNTLLESETGRFAIIAGDKGGKISFTHFVGKSDAYVDVIYFRHVISNILENAVKYTVLPPLINVVLEKVNNDFKITFSDNGIGIEPSFHTRIFEKFFRVPTGNTHDVKGFGLGLSYACAVVKAHKGTINVVSEPGKGSSFIITIPANG